MPTFIQRLRNRFLRPTTGRLRSLASVSADELRRERIRTEQAETRISREIDLQIGRAHV